MNVAVDDRQLRQGIATALLEPAVRARRTSPASSTRSRSATSNDGAIRSVRALRLPLRRPAPAATTTTTRRTPLIMWRTATPARPWSAEALAPPPLILGDRDELRRHLRRARHRRRRDPLQRDRLAGAAARALRRRGAGDRLAPPPRAGRRGHRRRARARRALGSATSTRVAVTRGPGLIGALLVGVSSGEGAGRRARGCRSRPSTTCTATWWRARSATTRSSRPSSASWPAAATRSSRAWTSPPATRCSARRSTTPRARRSTRAPACSASATRAARRSTGWRARATPRRSTSRASLPGDGLDFSFSGLKTALLYRVRDLGEAEAERAARTSPPPTSARSWTRSWPRARAALEREGLERLRDRRRRGGQLGAARGACDGRWTPSCRVPPMALCTDNAAMIAAAARFAQPLAYPDYLDLDASARTARHDRSSPSTASPAATSARTPRRRSSGAAPRARFELREVDVSHRPGAQPRLRRAHPGRGRRRRGGVRVLRRCRCAGAGAR